MTDHPETPGRRREDEPLLGLATTRELLGEVATRMEITQNSIKGRDLGRLCREAIDNLAASVLDYRPVGPWIPQTDVDDPAPDEVPASGD